jgi:heterogeneous nuclear ribonucleoprotein U
MEHNRPILWMLIGVPGSGKSTWVNRHQFRTHTHTDVVSTDAIIEGIASMNNKTYNDVFKDNIKFAEKTMYTEVMEAVKNDWDIIWDQTNISKKARAKKLIMIPDHYIKYAVVFPTPEDDVLEQRLASRPGKTIPSYVIDGMIEMFEMPEDSEGFDAIYVEASSLYKE